MKSLIHLALNEQIATMMKDDGTPVSPKIPIVDDTNDSEIHFPSSYSNLEKIYDHPLCLCLLARLSFKPHEN